MNALLFRNSQSRRFAEAVGRRIKEEREARNLTRAEFARRLQRNITTIDKIENGASKLDAFELALIAEEFDVTLDELVPVDATPERDAIPPTIQKESSKPQKLPHKGFTGNNEVVRSNIVKVGQVWSFDEPNGERVTFEVTDLMLTINGPRAIGRTSSGKRIKFPMKYLKGGSRGARLERDVASQASG